MSYGFDPSELIETKVDLIDKDGFHGVGESSNNDSNSDTSNAISSGVIYLKAHLDQYNNTTKYVHCLMCLRKEEYPELFEFGRPTYVNSGLYLGDKIDSSRISHDGESNEAAVDGVASGAAFNRSNYNAFDDFMYVYGDWLYESSEVPGILNPSEIENNSVVNLILVCTKSNGGQNVYVYPQLSFNWTISPSDFEE